MQINSIFVLGVVLLIYDFDETIERVHTESTKWDNVGSRIGNPDALPMWVADTDFRCPQPVVDAVCARAAHPIYGYTFQTPKFKEVTGSWLQRRNGWSIDPEWVVFSTGVVPIIYTMVQAFTQHGDGIIIQQPVYYPFADSIKDNGRQILNNQLLYRDGRYEIDFDQFEELAARSDVKLFVLCNPHNPVGRVWTRDELLRLSEICLKNNVIVISDEIHSDLMLFQHKHIPVGSLGEEYAMNTVACYAPSKTFNMAGLRASGTVVANPDIRKKLSDQIRKNRSAQQHIFALPAYIAAYEQCEDYLEQLIPYLEGNVLYLKERLEQRMPKLKLVDMEATYLAWIDCSALGMSNDSLADFFVQQCRVAITRGDIFGDSGGGFIRMNLGCTRNTLIQALTQIEAEYQKIENA